MAAKGLWLRTADLRRRRPAALVEGPVGLPQVAEGFVFVAESVFVICAALFMCSSPHYSRVLR